MKFNSLLLLSWAARALAASPDDRRELVSSKKIQAEITTKKCVYDDYETHMMGIC